MKHLSLLRPSRRHSINLDHSRRELADNWQRLLDAARVPPTPRSQRAPLQRAAVLSAEHDVRQMIALLRRPDLEGGHGLAVAGKMLTDGAGPLYNRHRAADLDREVRAVVRALT